MSNTFSFPAASKSSANLSRRANVRIDSGFAAALPNILRGLRIAADLGGVALAYTVSTSLLKNYTNVPMNTTVLLSFLPVVIAVKALTLSYFGALRCSLRHAGIPDFLALAYSAVTSGLLLFAVTRLAGDQVAVPGIFLALDGAMTTGLLTVGHLSVRVYASERSRLQKCARKVVVIGAGDGGASIVRQLLMDQNTPIRPVAVVDDDAAKVGTSICGVPVVGDLRRLQRVVSSTRAAEVLICIPSATRSQMGRILAVCRKCGVPVRSLPTLRNLVDHTVSLGDLQRIQIEDVLQRERIAPDTRLAKRLLGGKTVLVTGAGGSIGSELCLQIAAAGPERMILVDKSENNLFYSHLAVMEKFPNAVAELCLTDITNMDVLRAVFDRARPSLVFHAAAFKHVGMMQLHPQEAIRNNVLGTRNVASLAAEYGAERMVNVSTDKAVNPSCYMGLSKKLAELTVKHFGETHKTKFLNVRFGNVAGSSGSVLRLFSDQINKGGPIRVTDPRATRFFMSIPEAVYLILCAAARGKGGETYIFDMGEPVNIYQLARTMSLFSGYIPEEELSIEFIGLRDGEKIHEELWESWEHPQATENPFLFVLKGQDPTPIEVMKALEEFEASLSDRNYDRLIALIDNLVPGFAENRIPRFQVCDYSVKDALIGEVAS